MIKSITKILGRIGPISLKFFVGTSGKESSIGRNDLTKPIRIWDNSVTNDQYITYNHMGFIEFDYNGYADTYDKNKKFFIPYYQIAKLLRLFKKILKSLESKDIFEETEDGRLQLYETDIKENTFIEYGFTGNLAIMARPIIYTGKDDVEYEAIQLVLSTNKDGITLTADELIYLIYILDKTDFCTLANTMITNTLLLYTKVGRENLDYSYTSKNDQRSAEDIYIRRVQEGEAPIYKSIPISLRNDNLLNTLKE